MVKSKLTVLGLTLAGLSSLIANQSIAMHSGELKVGALVQADVVDYTNDRHGILDVNPATGHGNRFVSDTGLRRADIDVYGTLADCWRYDLRYRASAEELRDAWVGYDGWDPVARISLGKMKIVRGLENFSDEAMLTFIGESGGQAVWNYVALSSGGSQVAGGVADFAGSRNGIGLGLGAYIEGNPVDMFGYQAGVYTSNDKNGLDFDNTEGKLTWAARVFVHPYAAPGRVLHVGADYQHINLGLNRELPLVSFRAMPGSFNIRGSRDLIMSTPQAMKSANLWGGEAAVIWNQFLAQGEYWWMRAKSKGAAAGEDPSAGSSQHHDGWYVLASWVLTGESRDYDHVSGTVGGTMPHSRFGAWELAARYDEVDLHRHGVALNDAGTTGNVWFFGGKERDWTLGANWYANRDIKLMLNYVDAKTRNVPAAPASSGLSSKSVHVGAWAFRAQVNFD